VEKSSLSCLSAAKRFARNLGVLVGMAMLARHGRHQGLQPFGRLRIRGAILEQRPQPFRCGIETTVMADLVLTSDNALSIFGSDKANSQFSIIFAFLFDGRGEDCRLVKHARR
jgi:hypothetical protein